MAMILNPGRFAAAGGVDPNFANVVLLCHFDGADGTNTFVDHSSSAKTLTALGGVQHDTAVSYFGGSSCLFDGSGDRLFAADSADWHFNTGPLTIECFVRHAAGITNEAYITQWGASQGWAFYTDGSLLKLRANIGGSHIDLSYFWLPTVGQWYHIAYDRDATGKARLFVDGVMVVSHATSQAGSWVNSTSDMTIGAIGTGGLFPTYDFDGHIDEVRITKGVSRYGSDSSFTVPALPFPNS